MIAWTRSRVSTVGLLIALSGSPGMVSADRPSFLDITGTVARADVVELRVSRPSPSWILGPDLLDNVERSRPGSKDLLRRLDGRSIRDMVAVNGGFSSLRAHSAMRTFPFASTSGTGADQLPGGENGPHPDRLGDMTNLDDAKPEGLTVVSSQGKTYEILVVLEGAEEQGSGLDGDARP